MPGPVLLSTIFRMLFLIRKLWTEELAEEKDVKIHSDIFYLDSYNYFGTERVGGSFSYLKHKYQGAIKSKLRLPAENHTVNENNDNNSCK